MMPNSTFYDTELVKDNFDFMLTRLSVGTYWDLIRIKEDIDSNYRYNYIAGIKEYFPARATCSKLSNSTLVGERALKKLVAFFNLNLKPSIDYSDFTTLSLRKINTKYKEQFAVDKWSRRNLLEYKQLQKFLETYVIYYFNPHSSAEDTDALWMGILTLERSQNTLSSKLIFAIHWDDFNDIFGRIHSTSDLTKLYKKIKNATSHRVRLYEGPFTFTESNLTCSLQGIGDYENSRLTIALNPSWFIKAYSGERPCSGALGFMLCTDDGIFSNTLLKVGLINPDLVHVINPYDEENPSSQSITELLQFATSGTARQIDMTQEDDHKWFTNVIVKNAKNPSRYRES